MFLFNKTYLQVKFYCFLCWFCRSVKANQEQYILMKHMYLHLWVGFETRFRSFNRILRMVSGVSRKFHKGARECLSNGVSRDGRFHVSHEIQSKIRKVKAEWVSGEKIEGKKQEKKLEKQKKWKGWKNRKILNFQTCSLEFLL